MDRHPTTQTWTLPPADRPALDAPLRRTNLRALAARPGRFEHHLMVVARVGDTQLEIATASEPLYFAHRNITDEYAVPLRTGDPMLDAFPYRTFFADFDSNEDIGRIKHRCEQVVLHPHGSLHWPGKLRPPHKPFEFAEGMRRTGLTLVYCGWKPSPPSPAAPLFVSEGNDGATKAYGGRDLRFHLADLHVEDAGVVAAVAGTAMTLVVEPTGIAPPNGGYAVVIDADGERFFPADLIYIPKGASLAATGIRRAVVVSGARPEPPPASWDAAPEPPFAVYEDGEAGSLPVDVEGMRIEEVSDQTCRVVVGDASAEVPRYWLARFLFRTALHDFALGYLETYGGFSYSDADAADVVRLGLRQGGSIELSRARARDAVEALYRAVAPPGYIERVS